MVKICLRATCQDIGIVPNNGQPARCEIRLELDHNVSLEYHRYHIQLLVPTEFATLLEVGRTVTMTLEQNGD
jgi:hypothetical protein